MRSRTRIVAVIAVAAVAGGTLATPAGAAPSKNRKSCAQRVILDWSKNERLDRRYPIRCYTRALRIAPDDLRLYTSFSADVRKARAKAIRSCKRRFGFTSRLCRP